MCENIGNYVASQFENNDDQSDEILRRSCNFIDILIKPEKRSTAR